MSKQEYINVMQSAVVRWHDVISNTCVWWSLFSLCSCVVMTINDVKGRVGWPVINTIRSWLAVFTLCQCTCVTIHCPNVALVFISISCGYDNMTRSLQATHAQCMIRGAEKMRLSDQLSNSGALNKTISAPPTLTLVHSHLSPGHSR